MADLSQWDMKVLLLGVLVLSLVVSAFRMAGMARRYGRRPWVWFLVSLFLTAIPATIVFWGDSIRNRRSASAARRCPHCGAILDSPLPANCPHCRMTLSEDRYA